MHDTKSSTGFPSIVKPWLKYYSEELIHARLPECTVYEYLWENNKEYPNEIALYYVGRKITYKELFKKIDQTAKAFYASGIRSGDIVTVALPSIPEAIYCVCALNKIGAVANMVHPLAGENELIQYLNEVNTQVAVLFDETYKILQHAFNKTSVRLAVVVSAGESLPWDLKAAYAFMHRRQAFQKGPLAQHWSDFIRAGHNVLLIEHKKDIHSMAIISHTGGTTGEPKGVMCSDYNIVALIWQVGQTLPSVRQENMLVVLPPFINYSLVNGMLEPLSLGHKVILIPDYKAERFASYIKSYKPNHINTIPAYLKALLQYDEAKKISYASFKYVYYGGEAMPEETELAINELITSHGAKHRLGKGLGSTEMVSSATLTTEACNLPGSAGIPFVKVNCKIVEVGTKYELPYGMQGEICFSGPTLMMGYYNKPDETNDVIKTHDDGERWLHTGDLGYINSDGVLFVTGRIKRIIMTKGKDQQVTKIFPDRVERVLNEYPAVRLSCVIGVPDSFRINYPKAMVELKTGYEPSEQLAEKIKLFCRGKLPEYQVPDEVAFVNELPRTEREKVDYRALEEMAKNEQQTN